MPALRVKAAQAQVASAETVAPVLQVAQEVLLMLEVYLHLIVLQQLVHKMIL